MLRALYLLVVLISVSSVFRCTSSTENNVNPNKNIIRTADAEVEINRNVTFPRGGLKVISFLATFLRFIGTTRISILMKGDNNEETFQKGSRATNNTGEEIYLQFNSTRLIKLGEGNNYYYFETSLRLNFFEAFEFCRRKNMHLLSIETKEEDNHIKRYLFNKFPKVECVWTSGTDLGREGHYVWLSTGQPVTYTNWHPVYVVEPNHANNKEHCIHSYQFFNSPHFFYWNDVSCGVSYHFVCETELHRIGQ